MLTMSPRVESRVWFVDLGCVIQQTIGNPLVNLRRVVKASIDALEQISGGGNQKTVHPTEPRSSRCVSLQVMVFGIGATRVTLRSL